MKVTELELGVTQLETGPALIVTCKEDGVPKWRAFNLTVAGIGFRNSWAQFLPRHEKHKVVAFTNLVLG